MQRDYDAFQKLSAEIVVVTRHDAATMRDYWTQNKLTYLGVPDPEGRITSRYRQQWKLFRLGRMPAQFLVDCAGKLAFAHYGTSMSDIPQNAQMLKLISNLDSCRPSAE